MVDVFKEVSFLELGQGNIIILRKKKFVYLELIWKRSNKPKPPSLSLLAWTLWPFINVLDVSQKSQALLVSQAMAHTHTVQKLGWAWWLDPIATQKKKNWSHSIYETCTCMEQESGSWQTASCAGCIRSPQPSAHAFSFNSCTWSQTGIHFPFCFIIIAALFVALKSFSHIWNTVKYT